MPRKQLSPEYQSYIASEAWRRRRSLKLFLAGGMCGTVECEVCHQGIPVAVANAHHKTYERFEHERLSDLAVVCRRCHDALEEIEELADGGDVMAMSPKLVTLLVTIDNRLGIPIPRQIRPQPPEATGPATIGDLVATVEAKRKELGIVVKDTGP